MNFMATSLNVLIALSGYKDTTIQTRLVVWRFNLKSALAAQPVKRIKIFWNGFGVNLLLFTKIK